MPKIELDPGETVVKKAMANYSTGGFFGWKQGTAYLTTHRFVFHKKSLFISVMFGVIGMLLDKGAFLFDIPLYEITQISQTKLGLNRKVLTITTQDGNTYPLTLKFDQWRMLFDAALQESYGRSLQRTSHEPVWDVVER